MADKKVSQLDVLTSLATDDEFLIADTSASASKRITRANLATDLVGAVDLDGLSDVSAITHADSQFLVDNGTNWVGESGATARTSLGVGTGDSPQFTGIELGHATDTTLTRASAGDVNIEGNIVYRAGGTDVAVADGGTGQGSYTDGQLLIGNTTGNTLAKATLTAGEGIDITNGGGSITILGENASTTNKGILEIATIAETNTGTDTTRAVSPDGLDGWTGSAQVTTLGTISSGTWSATDIAVTAGGTGSSTASGARTNLGVAIGSDVQAFDAVLDDLAALTAVSGADEVIVSTGAGAYAHEAASTLPATIGGVIQDLDTLGAAGSDGEFIVATGAGAFAYESGSTARDSLSLGTSDTPQFLRLGIGAAADGTHELLVNGTSEFNGDISMIEDAQTVLNLYTYHNTDSTATLIQFNKAGGTEASPTTVANGERIGNINFMAHDGTDLNNAVALIRCEIDGTPGTDDTPGRLIFYTTKDGARLATEALRLDSSQNATFAGVIDCASGIKLGASDNYGLAGDTSNDTQVLRRIILYIQNGTNANTLKCKTTSQFNGDVISSTDNIAKNGTTGDFTLDANGEVLTVEASGLTGNVVMAHGTTRFNYSGTDLTYDIQATANDIYVNARNSTSGASQDLTSLVDTGQIQIHILYITDA